MTTEDRVIKDIRYYIGYTELLKRQPITVGNFWYSFIDNIKKILNLDKKYNGVPAIGQRIARKLNEYNFVSGVFDHIYINYRATISEGQINISPMPYEERIMNLDFGVSADKIQEMTDKQKEEFIIRSTFRCLEHLYKDNKEKIAMIKKVEAEVQKFGPQLEINYLTKETKEYAIKIYYKIRPDNDLSYAFIEYYDKKNDLRKRACIELQLHDDIYYLIDRVSVKEDRIVLSPKTSFTADIWNKRYTTPISLEISKMPVI